VKYIPTSASRSDTPLEVCFRPRLQGWHFSDGRYVLCSHECSTPELFISTSPLWVDDIPAVPVVMIACRVWLFVFQCATNRKTRNVSISPRRVPVVGFRPDPTESGPNSFIRSHGSGNATSTGPCINPKHGGLIFPFDDRLTVCTGYSTLGTCYAGSMYRAVRR
jgi:hypothetical protein